MKTTSQMLVLLIAVFILGGCINPDQGGQRGKMEGRDTTGAPTGTDNSR